MSKINKILCAIDFSEATDKVVEWAGFLAKSMQSEVLLLYVVPNMSRYASFDVSAGYISNFEREILHGAKHNMGDLLKRILAGVKAKGMVVQGDPSEEILKAAKEQDADSIVVGTHGRKGLDRVVFGSVAEKVVKTSTIPVLTVRPYGAPRWKGRPDL